MRKNWITLFLLTFCFGISSLNAQHPITFLEGKWKVENKNVFEEWTKVDDRNYAGESYKMNGEEKTVIENLAMEIIGSDVYYSAEVIGQNDGKAVQFLLDQRSDSVFVFENPQHDFPKKIVYVRKGEYRVLVRVLGDNNQGSSFYMDKQNVKKEIPEWFKEEMNMLVGTWITDNSEYVSQEEPAEEYGMEWEWGIGQTSIKGRLFGLKGKKDVQTFWEFRQYWDNVKQEGRLIQYGPDGVLGDGKIWRNENGMTETVQTFSLEDGRKWEGRHLSQFRDGAHVTSSYDRNSDGSWRTNRQYFWYKQKPKVEVIDSLALGKFSISLAVADIDSSYNFYKTLGFESLTDTLASDQKWVILVKDDVKIGLFEGMFPTNTLTLNPPDARALYRLVQNAGIDVIYALGMEEDEGPCSFSFMDPDGNPVLVDQIE